MDVENRGLEEGGDRTDPESGFSESGAGTQNEAGNQAEYAGEGVPQADAQPQSADEAMDETASGDAIAAAAADGAGEDTNLTDDVYEIDPSPHSLLSVLFPAKPPRPRNARIVRLFDLEAAKNDPEPGEAPEVEPPPKEEPRTREAIRAARNQSLLVAARLR
jgi:hypothetical protein